MLSNKRRPRRAHPQPDKPRSESQESLTVPGYSTTRSDRSASPAACLESAVKPDCGGSSHRSNRWVNVARALGACVHSGRRQEQRHTAPWCSASRPGDVARRAGGGIFRDRARCLVAGFRSLPLEEDREILTLLIGADPYQSYGYYGGYDRGPDSFSLSPLMARTVAAQGAGNRTLLSSFRQG